MKNLGVSIYRLAVFAGLTFVCLSASQAQTFITGTYVNDFDVGTNKADFAGSGSVASWLYWYGATGFGSYMTNEVSLDVNNNPSSGSLMVVSSFGAGPEQNVFFGTFGNQSGYDFSERANLSMYQSIYFWIRMAPGTPPRMIGGSGADFGTIGVGIITTNYVYQEIGRPTIPLAASNAWILLIVPIDHNQPNLEDVPGIAFDINSYADLYPQFSMTNYIDRLELVPAFCFECDLPPILSAPQKAISGLNCIASSVTGATPQTNRYQAGTAADIGYAFVGRPSVTYSWNIKAFPANTGGNFRQHFFIVNGAPGPNDQAADYNLADCLFMTVQQSDAGTATFSFRYKTNDPGDNAMLLNTNPTNTNGWPVMPYATLSTTNGALGTWSVTFAGDTNVTVTAPDNSSTNFNIPPAVAALFADPVTLILGGQPNSANGFGKAVVYGNFSATGCAAPFSDNFDADTTLNTALWKNLSSDTNGLYLVQPTAAYWVAWTSPLGGFQLQVRADNNTAGGWTQPKVPILMVNAKAQALIDSNQLPSITQGYFQMVEYHASQLQVLVEGETNAPGTPTGKTGSPTPVSLSSGGGQAMVNVTINAVDPTFHIVPGIYDSVNLTSSADPYANEPPPAPLVNGSMTTSVFIDLTGNYTVTATDTNTIYILPGTSSSVTITP